jgi:phosphomannomutase
MRTDIDTSIFKSYDVRGIVPAQLNDDIAYAIGRAFVEVLDRKNICVGRDMRPSGSGFVDAFSRTTATTAA